MKFRAKFYSGIVAGLLAFSASAQLVITNGVQTYAALTGTTVTMSNRCELRVTGTNSPISGSVINLNSPDAWFFLPGIKPSVVAASYLSQIFVSGAAAVADSNVRIVQYGAGAVVIPHSAAFQPLQVFTGPHFTGASAQYSQYTYYTGTGLGAFDMNISSFKLKRGYMAVVAQNTGGNGFSKSYVAQDGDLEVSLLPASLDNKIRFIYVTPWRWVSKKGIAGNIENGLNVAWKYNWNIDQNSTRDLEYVPIRATRWWPDLGQNWQALGANTVLGYNEPDNTAQANLAVGDAIWSWPDLLGTGLRVGAPAVTDGGRSSWLYPFIAQADAANLRVDFVAVHYYQCYDPANPAGAATQLYNFLKATYDQVKRPLWLTEWNNGANWTGCGDPTFAQQQAAISAMIDMLEAAPFVERYSIYNWVEDVRRVEWDDGSLTDAGVTYRDKVSALSYQQVLPDNGQRSLAQFSFETNALDSSGYGNNGIAVGAPAYTTGHTGKAVVLDGTNNYIQLPPNVANSNNFTFAAWVNWNGGAQWQRIFDFGDDTTHYLFLTPSSSSGTLRFAINNGSGEQTLETTGLPVGQWRHVAFTLSGGNAKIYTNGVLAASSSSFTIAPASFTPMFNYLGRSQFAADPLFRGSLDDVQIADYAFTAAQIAALQTNSPPQFTTNILARGSAPEGIAYSNNIIAAATDPDPGDTLTYSKAGGLAWLNVSTNGILSGTPGAADGGTNFFTVRVTDAAGASAYALVIITTPVVAANGIWITNADGIWSDTNNWSGGAVANGIGYSADFSTLNITANRTVTLDTSRTLGTLKFGDTSGAQTWNVAASGGVVLTLDTGSATSPGIIVNQNSVTNGASLAGTNGFAKSGSGTLILGADSSLSGTVNIDTGSTTVNEGSVRLASPGALANASLIQIRNNNSGSSVLQLDGSFGNVTTPAPIVLSGRLSSSVSVQNLSGSNTLAGGLSLTSGGNYFVVQSDGGLLTLGGSLTAIAAGFRTFTFQGSGDTLISGIIQNGVATNNLVKTGSGNLFLAGANTHTGTNRITAGKITLANSAALQTSTLDMNATDAGNLSFGALTNATFGGLMGSRSIALTNLAAVAPTLAIGANNLPQAYSGALTGSGNLIKVGTNTFTLSGAGNFTGSTRVNAGLLTLGGGNALQNSLLDLNAADTGIFSFGTLTAATLGGLIGSKNLVLTNNSNVAVALTVGGGGQNSTYAGSLSGAGSLAKTGAGIFTLSSSNSYAGNTTISGGTLKLSRDPVLKLTFDNVSGTTNGSVITNDGSGGAALNGLLIGNGASIVSGGRFGNALTNNGVGGTAKTNLVFLANRGLNTDAAGNWTVAFWVKTTTAGAVILYQGDGGWSSAGQTTFLLNANSGSVAGTKAGAVRWAGGFLTGTAALNNGNWHFISLVDNAGTESIYVDGNLDAVTSSMGLPLATGANQIWIGGAPDSDAGAVKINGLIDEVVMFNRPLSLTEIRSLTNTLPAVTPGNFGGQLPAATTLTVAAGATFDLGGNSQAIAALADSSGAGGTLTNSGAAPVTLTLSATSGVNTFSGVIADNAATNALSLVKNGAATEILAGANNFHGTTVVNAGTLLVNGSWGTNFVSVNSGKFGGNGVLGGSLSVQSATLAPGGSVGILTVSNNITLAPGSITLMELDKSNLTNDQLFVGGTLTLNGTLALTNLSSALTGGDTFKLFSAATTTGNFTALTGSPGAGLDWKFTASNGVLTVYSTVSPNLDSTVTNGALQLSWPTDHLGWTLQVQTNNLAAGLGTNWFSLPITAGSTQFTAPLDTVNESVFYRLIYQ